MALQQILSTDIAPTTSISSGQLASNLTLSGNTTFTGNVVVQGGLQVTGNVTTVNYETINYTETANVLVANSVVSPVIGSASGSTLSLQSNGVTNATLDTNGRFIITTTNGGAYDSNTPGIYFQRQSSTAETNVPFIRSQSNGSTTTDLALGPSSTSGRLLFYTSGQNVGLFNASGYLGIGTTSPQEKLHVAGNLDIGASPGGIGSFRVTTANQGLPSPVSVRHEFGTDNTGWQYRIAKNQGGNITDLMTITDSGYVGIGTTGPTNVLAVYVNGTTNLGVDLQANSSAYGRFGMVGPFGTNNDTFIGSVSNNNLLFYTVNAERARITPGGRLGISITSPSELLHVGGNIIGSSFYPTTQPPAPTSISGMGSSGVINWWNYGGDATSNAVGTGTYFPYIHWSNLQASYGYRHHTVLGTYRDGGGDWGSTIIGVGGNDNYPTVAFYFNYTGSFSASGSINGSTKNFKIAHPLPSMANTHNLIHAAVEAPRLDLIYRGEVQLTNGQANVDIDTESNMTDGTFVALCRKVQCFTTNETDWTPIRGKVNGNILSIEAQDPTSNATISWMVIGERQDKNAKMVDVTNDDGELIVETVQLDEDRHRHESLFTWKDHKSDPSIIKNK
jgi:hypothetical protein